VHTGNAENQPDTEITTGTSNNASEISVKIKHLDNKRFQIIQMIKVNYHTWTELDHTAVHTNVPLCHSE